MTAQRRRPTLGLLTIAVLSLPPSSAASQGHPQPGMRGTTPALTLGLGGGQVGIAASALVGFRRGPHEMAIRGLLGLKAGHEADRSETLVDAGFLYGLHPFRDPRILALRAGVSGIWYTKDPGALKPARTYDPVVGIPLEIALSSPTSRTRAIGVTAAGNLNRVRRYAAFFVTLTFGAGRPQ